MYYVPAGHPYIFRHDLIRIGNSTLATHKEIYIKEWTCPKMMGLWLERPVWVSMC